MDVSAQQQEALDAIEGWWNGSDGQVFRLFGYAGTGKTTIARLVPEMLGLVGRVRFAAYTGKAAHVLAKKGCTPVSTIHSLIYRPVEVIAECPYGDACEARNVELNTCAHMIKSLEFSLKESLDPEPSATDDVDVDATRETRLLILDEVSMVSDDLARDVMSFGVRVLVLGDPAQLPPIHGSGYFVNAEPDFMLTEVHRQAAESPVLRLATAVRTTGRTGRPSSRPSMAQLMEAGQILVWRNATRWSIVRTLRAFAGRPAGVPTVGDRVMCLANNRGLGIFNGQQFWVTGVSVKAQDASGTTVYTLSLVDEQPAVYTIDVMADGFRDQKGEEEVRRNGSRGTWAAMTFANAITVHKAQGSEWDTVIVVDESSGIEWMHNKRGEDGAAARRTWLYTAITRAAREVVLADSKGW